jgi:ABC-2 type transport system ATP-binding protein
MRIELHGSLDQSEEPLAQRAIGEVTGIREISVERRRVLARADDGAAAIPAVLAALDRAGVRVAGVTVARPSLDDVYLRYVGRGITAAGLATVPAELVGAR